MRAGDAVERVWTRGVERLSDHDLLEVLIGADAEHWLAGGLRALAVHPNPPVVLRAALELGRRVHRYTPNGQPLNVDLLAQSLIARYAHAVQEHLGVVLLDARHRVLRDVRVYVGTAKSALVGTRDVLRHALDWSASAMIVYHNHPGGDSRPSSEDVMYTSKLVVASEALGVDVVDHLVVGVDVYSFRVHGGM